SVFKINADALELIVADELRKFIDEPRTRSFIGDLPGQGLRIPLFIIEVVNHRNDLEVGAPGANQVERAPINVGNYRMIARLQPQPFRDKLVELIYMTLKRFITRIIPIDVKPESERTGSAEIGPGGRNPRLDLRSVKRSFRSRARGFLCGSIGVE